MINKLNILNTYIKFNYTGTDNLFIYRIHAAIIFLIAGMLSQQIYSQPLAQGKSKFLGNAITTGTSIPGNFTTFWNQVTPGNSGKWGSVESSQGVYNWTPLDNIYNYAVSNNMPFKEHNLVWGQQQPGFISSLDSASQRTEVENWIKACGERYPLAAFCDVVNEPLHAPPSYANALGGSGTTGWDWVITAFQLARQYFSPNTKLLINEYNILQDNTVTNNYIKLIDTLKVRGLIDGIGIQGHYFELKSAAGASPSYSYPVKTIQNNLNKLTATGLPVYISEFDIDEADDNTQLQNYQTYFPLFWENPGVKGITLWGYIQYDVWKPNAYLITDRRAQRPALKWLRTYLTTYLQSTLISPDGTTAVPRDPVLTWYSSTAAKYYHIQVAADSTFISTVVDSTVSDTLLQLGALLANTKYYWRIIASNDGDTGASSSVSGFTTNDIISGVKEKNGIPGAFSLLQNYPNPFNPVTNINYEIPKDSFVKLRIYDILGRVVANLVDKVQSANKYSIAWKPSGLSSGIYLYQLEAKSVDGAEKFYSVMKLILLK